MHEATVGQLPQSRHAFVDGMVDLEVLTLHIGVALSPGVEPEGEDPDVVLRAFADHERIARQAASLVNQGRGGRPLRIVEHGIVHRRQDACNGVLGVHDDFRLFSGRRSGTNGTEVRSRRRPASDPVPALAQRPARLRVRSRIRVSVRCYYYIRAIILSLVELLVNDRNPPNKVLLSADCLHAYLRTASKAPENTAGSALTDPTDKGI